MGSIDLDTQQRLGALIRERHGDIESRWLARVQADVSGRKDVSLTDLRDGIGDYLSQLARSLESGKTLEGEAGGENWQEIVRQHGITRVRLGFDVDQLLREFAILRQILYQLVEEHGISLARAPVLLADYVDQAVAASVHSYVQARDYQARQVQAETVGMLIHDLRSLLTSAMLATTRLRGQLQGAQADALGRIESSHHRLLEVVDSVLTMQTLEAGQGNFHPRLVSLAEVLDDVVERSRAAALAKGLTFESDYDGAATLHADPVLLRSAAENVIGNAVKYTENGYVEVVVNEAPKELVLHVRDTCGGISAEELRTIFEPFKRGPARDRRSGTGLGLAMARRAVEAHGGSIMAESPGERGCHFALRLPKG